MIPDGKCFDAPSEVPSRSFQASTFFPVPVANIFTNWLNHTSEGANFSLSLIWLCLESAYSKFRAPNIQGIPSQFLFAGETVPLCLYIHKA